MSRRRASAMIFAVASVAGCSLLTSTDELSNGGATPADAATEPTPDGAGDSGVTSDALNMGDADAPPDSSLTDAIVADVADARPAPSPCLLATYDRCYDFSGSDVSAGWSSITAGTTFDLSHFTRDTTTFVSSPASLKYRNPATNYSYFDSFNSYLGESGKNTYVSFRLKVTKFGLGLQLGLFVLAIDSALGGDIYFYQKNGLYFIASRYWDGAKYWDGPRSADFQTVTQDEWHRYEFLVTSGVNARLQFAVDGDVGAGIGVKYDVSLNSYFKPGPPTIRIGLWDHNDNTKAPSEREVYYDDVILNVTQ